MFLLMVLGDLLCGDLVMVAKLAAILSRNTKLPSARLHTLSAVLVVGRVIPVEERLVAALDDEFGDVHGCAVIRGTNCAV